MLSRGKTIHGKKAHQDSSEVTKKQNKKADTQIDRIKIDTRKIHYFTLQAITVVKTSQDKGRHRLIIMPFSFLTYFWMCLLHHSANETGRKPLYQPPGTPSSNVKWSRSE